MTLPRATRKAKTVVRNLILVSGQVSVLFALMGVGAVLRKAKWVDEKGISGFTNLLILVVTPCLIVDCFQRPFDSAMLTSLASAFLIAVAIHLVAILLAGRVIRHPGADTRHPLQLAAVFSNAGFMGIPLEQAILGETGVFFGIVYVVVFNLFIWSWGVWRMRREDRCGMNRWKMWVNPGTVGIMAGLPLFLFSIRLPSVASVSIHHLANLNTPLAMIVIGYSLAGARLGRVMGFSAAYGAVFVRLIVCPLLMIAALLPFRGLLDRRMMLVLVIAASAPVAAMVSMLAVKFGRDVDTSVAVVCGSTILSIFTMPPVIALAMAVF